MFPMQTENYFAARLVPIWCQNNLTAPPSPHLLPLCYHFPKTARIQSIHGVVRSSCSAKNFDIVQPTVTMRLETLLWSSLHDGAWFA